MTGLYVLLEAVKAAENGLLTELKKYRTVINMSNTGCALDHDLGIDRAGRDVDVQKERLRAVLERKMEFMRRHGLTDEHLILARGPPGIDRVPKCAPEYERFVNVMRNFDAVLVEFMKHGRINGWQHRLYQLEYRRDSEYDALARVVSHCEALERVLVKYFPLHVVELIIKFMF